MRPQAVLSAYSHRRWWARALVDALVAVGWLVCAWATAALVSRVAGWPDPAAVWSSHWWWALPTAATIYGALCGRRETVGRDRAAAELDGEMELGGLLVVARQAEAEGGQLPEDWARVLDKRMEFVREHLPRPRPRRAVLPLLIGAWFAFVVSLLPEPRGVQPPRGDFALAARLADLGELAQGLRAAGVIDEARLAELAGRLGEFEGLLGQGGGALEWADVDTAAAELSRLAGEHAGQLDGLLGGLAAAAAEPEMLATALEWARDMGLAEGLLDGVGVGPAAGDPATGGTGLAGLDAGAVADLIAAAGGDGARDPRVREVVDRLTERVESQIERFGGQLDGALPGLDDLVGTLRGAVGEARRSDTRSSARPAAPLVAERSEMGAAAARPVAWKADVLPRHRAAVRRFFAEGEGK